MSAPLLRVAGLSGGYDRHMVVHDINLEARPGSVSAIVGPNGHGKTALLWLLSGLSRPATGTIHFDGQDITGWAPHRIARLGLAQAPQGDLLFPQMSIQENLRMGAYRLASSSEASRRRDFVLSLFPKLAQREQQIAGSLSGGERRMVGLGRALMSGARMLLIDEPSLGLAPIVIDQIYDAIEQMRADGMTIIVVEENPERASSVAEQIFVMDDGRFVMSGAPEDVLSRSSLMDAYFGGGLE